MCVYGGFALAGSVTLVALQCMRKSQMWGIGKSKNMYCSQNCLSSAHWRHPMTCQIFFSGKMIFSPDKIRPHLCTCCCDTDLTISLFTRRAADKEYALRHRAPPVKPGPSMLWKKYQNLNRTRIFNWRRCNCSWK